MKTQPTLFSFTLTFHSLSHSSNFSLHSTVLSRRITLCRCLHTPPSSHRLDHRLLVLVISRWVFDLMMLFCSFLLMMLFCSFLFFWCSFILFFWCSFLTLAWSSASHLSDLTVSLCFNALFFFSFDVALFFFSFDAWW